MERATKPRCGHGDCFTCPYDDCIVTEDVPKKRGPGRPKLPPGVVAQHQKEWRLKNYQEHKEELNEKSRKYYRENTDKVKAKQKEYRERRKKGL